MAAHMLNHCVVTARRISECTNNVLFVFVVFAIVANFWCFRGVAWAINGPIDEHWGLGWGKVRFELLRRVQSEARIAPFTYFFY